MWYAYCIDFRQHYAESNRNAIFVSNAETGMKKMLKYLLHVALFLGIVALAHAWVPEAALTTTADQPVSESGFIFEKAPDFAPGIPDELLVPAQRTVSFARQVRVLPSAPVGISAVARFTTGYPDRDSNKNYSQIITLQDSLPPILSPSLEYVFLLRSVLS